MLFLMLTLVEMYLQCLWRAMDVSRWTPSIFGLCATSSSESAIIILGWFLACWGKSVIVYLGDLSCGNFFQGAITTVLVSLCLLDIAL